MIYYLLSCTGEVSDVVQTDSRKLRHRGREMSVEPRLETASGSEHFATFSCQTNSIDTASCLDMALLVDRDVATPSGRNL